MDPFKKIIQEAQELQEKSQHIDALSKLKQVTRHVPNHFPAWFAMGQSHVALSQGKEATDCLKESLKHCPDFYPATILLARVYHRFFQKTEVAQSLIESVTRQNPNLPDADLAMGDIFMSLNQFDLAKDYLRSYVDKQKRFYELNPAGDYVDTLAQELLVNLTIPTFPKDEEDEQTALKALEDHCQKYMSHEPSESWPETLTPSVFYLGYYDVNVRPHMVALSNLYRTLFPKISYTSPHCQQPRKKGAKIKIGIVSTMLDREHAIGFCYGPLIKALPRDRYELTYFRLSTTQPIPKLNLRQRLGKIQTVDVPENMDQARQVISDAKLDILWYTDVQMYAQSYFLAHGRLAPIQCVSAGHPTTTGIDTVDYFISGQSLEPEDFQSHYSEKVACLPVFPVIYEEAPSKVSATPRSALGLPESGTLYYCAQSPQKIHPKMDPLFAQILAQDPQAILVFSYGESWIGQCLKARLMGFLGPHFDRCLFLSHVPQKAFFGLLKTMDVILDTYPFGGGNTSLQSISLGIPIVTLKPKYFRSAGTAALYQMMNMPDLIAQDEQAYVDLAIRLGTDATYRQDYSERILKEKHHVFHQEAAICKAYDDLFQDWSLQE